ncbi:MAG TPA: hypothetical protein VG253_11690 [Streptosporangiaceae bacterium]|nr:hypothetical protein [Streptosporangiaceae bacterium]
MTARTAVTSAVLAHSDRKHDDDKRAEERAYEASLRAQLAAGLKAAALADRRDREDRDAREVVVRTEGINQINSSDPNLRVILSTPNVSPVKQVQGALVRLTAAPCSTSPHFRVCQCSRSAMSGPSTPSR